MKSKTIRKVLFKKFDQFIQSIDDLTLRKLVEKNTIITGGCIASMLLKEAVNDYDLYFRTLPVAEAVARYFVKQYNGKEEKDFCVHVKDDRVKIIIRSTGISGDVDNESKPDSYENEIMQSIESGDERNASDIDGDKLDYKAVFMSANAISLSGKVQLIIRFHGEPEDIHSNYDFEHCMSYWTSWDDKLTIAPQASEALLARELRYVGSKYPLCSIIRTRKFIARGWSINAGQYLKMAMQLNELDLKNLDVLEDQLTGVDAAYFMQLISSLREVEPEKVNAGYIATIIDRIF